ncbi:hypothetical protein OUZ56_013809 [Daphnia magna]|uniref:Uncharacterized protein n=1 Tax=Daphnia magna TaxID=35525 RepID=A0ABQ9Z703_9CRUS|nr:hypothetical protein OUZ56_013809 [Daphnia magna]
MTWIKSLLEDTINQVDCWNGNPKRHNVSHQQRNKPSSSKPNSVTRHGLRIPVQRQSKISWRLHGPNGLFEMQLNVVPLLFDILGMGKY